MNDPAFEVGVLFHNNADLIRPFLYCLRRSCRLPFRILALSQGSKDETNTLLQSELREGVDRFSVWPDNRGIACGRNELLRLRTPHLPLYLTDCDCLVMRAGSCEALLSAIQPSSPYAQAFAVQRNFHDGSLPERGYSAAMLRPEVIERVGPFVESFRMFFDDSLFFERCLQLAIGWTIVAEAEVLHFCGTTTRTFPAWAEIHAQDRHQLDVERVRTLQA